MDPAFVGRISDLTLFGTDEFPEHGPDFHLNRFLQEMDHSFDKQDEL
jgi:hypothetical protein